MNYIVHFSIFVGCGHCKETRPHFEQAAIKMKDETNKMMAAVDCTSETGWSYVTSSMLPPPKFKIFTEKNEST